MATTIGGMTLPRLADHPEAAARLRDGMIAAVADLAIHERDYGASGAPGGHPASTDAEIHTFATRVVAAALPDVVRVLDRVITDVVLDDTPEIADH
jgi:hypothetical protein